MSLDIFARWATEEECLAEMLGLHDEDSAQAIVAGIRQRVSSDTLFKSLEGDLRVISKADDDELVVYGACSWEKVDPENDLITAGAMSKFFKKWFNVVPERYRNVMLMHKSFQAGVPLLKYQGSDGQMYYTHVHEKGSMLIAKIRDDDGLAQTVDLRSKVREGVYKSYSIGGVPTETEREMQGERLVTIIKDIDPGEVTICVTGMNDMAKFEIVKATDGTLQKPFAGYADFDACVKSVSARKKPPKDPKAYCAAIQAKVEDAKKALDEALKGMTLDQINAKIVELRAKLSANRKRIRAYWDEQETPDWLRELGDENDALYDELSAWREARVERIVSDAKKINIALKSMTLDQINAKITALRTKLTANRKRARDYWDSQETPDWVHTLEDENNAIYDELSAWREARVERIVTDAKAPPKEEKEGIDKILEEAFQPFFKILEEKVSGTEVTVPKSSVQPQDLKKVMKEAFDESMVNFEAQIREKMDEMTVEATERTPPQDLRKMVNDLFNESMDVLETRVKERIKSSESKPKSREEVSKAMDERTLETYLNVREIFKELENVE